MEFPEYSDSTDPSDIEYYYSPTVEKEEKEEQMLKEENMKNAAKNIPQLSKEEIKKRLLALKEDYSKSFVQGKSFSSDFK